MNFVGILLLALLFFAFLFRFLYLSSLAEKRGGSIDVSDLEELLLGCTELEVRFHLPEWLSVRCEIYHHKQN